MSKVIFKNASYNYDNLKSIIFEMIGELQDDLIYPEARVLIKPNLLLPAKPEKAVLTHPLVVRAVVEYVLSKGGRPLIYDSPAMGSIEKIKAVGGYQTALGDLNVPFKAFQATKKVDVGEPFGRIDIAREAIESDVVINLPKLKTHAGMLLTLGVKNLFGCIVGLQKPEWHLKSGVNRELFGRLLTLIYQAVNPSITIVDGILAMEGQGPGNSGKPRYLGVLAGGNIAFDVDMAICRLLGIDPSRLPTHNAAKQLGLVGKAIHINGEFHIINDFKFPKVAPVTASPKAVHKFMRKHLLQRPEVDDLQCTLCGECWQYCPAKTITRNKEKLDFNYDGCIRCFCCIEVCPTGALRSTEPLPGKVLRKLSILK